MVSPSVLNVAPGTNLTTSQPAGLAVCAWPWCENGPTRRGDSARQSPDRAEGEHGDQSGRGRLLVMAVRRRCTLRELEQSVAFGTDHFLGEEGPPEAAT